MQSPLLAQIGGHIDGRWQLQSCKDPIVVRNPADGAVLAEVPQAGEDDVRRAIESAARAMREVPPLATRRAWLETIATRLLESRDELGRIITLENGKPLAEARAEVEYSAGFFRNAAAHIDRLAPRVAAENVKGCRWHVYQRPAGVAGLITPWNFPLGMLAKKLSAVLAAGCGAVIKPARQTPLSVIALWNLLEAIDLPPGLLNLVIGESGPIARALFDHPLVRVISFTGSTEIGRKLIESSAPGIKRLSLELGGNAPFIVMEDADIAAAAEGLIASKFRGAGQTCVCANRVLVHERVAPAFTEAVVERVARLRVGNGLDPETTIGPLIDRDGWNKVHEHTTDALHRGATRVFGEIPQAPQHDWGCFYPPTVLTGITRGMRIWSEETFGPVVAITTFGDKDDVLEMANDTICGRAAYVLTRDAERAARLAAGLHFGYVGWNTGTGPTPEAPFGGMKQSGFGREGGDEGLLEFCEAQTVAEKLP